MSALPLVFHLKFELQYCWQRGSQGSSIKYFLRREIRSFLALCDALHMCLALLPRRFTGQWSRNCDQPLQYSHDIAQCPDEGRVETQTSTSVLEPNFLSRRPGGVGWGVGTPEPCGRNGCTNSRQPNFLFRGFGQIRLLQLPATALCVFFYHCTNRKSI